MIWKQSLCSLILAHLVESSDQPLNVAMIVFESSVDLTFYSESEAQATLFEVDYVSAVEVVLL